MPIQFKAKISQPADGGDWLFLRIPQDASDQLPSRGMASVEGIVDGVDFVTTLQPDGEGGHWMRIEPALVHFAKLAPGKDAAFEIAPVRAEPEPDVPADLEKLLTQHPDSMKTWKATTAVARRDWIQWLGAGRKAETRGLRLEKMMDMLAKGKKRICCFDRSGKYSKDFSCPIAKD